MIWQDIVISSSNVLFVVSLINQVVHGFKNKRTSITLTTSALTTTGLLAMSIAFITLNLNISAAVSFLSTVLWTILGIQKVLYR